MSFFSMCVWDFYHIFKDVAALKTKEIGFSEILVKNIMILKKASMASLSKNQVWQVSRKRCFLTKTSALKIGK